MGNTENILSDSPLRRILDVLSNYSYKLLSLGDQKTKMSQCPHPPESTVGPTSGKGTCNFVSHTLLRMPQNATKWITRRLLQDCVYVPAEIC
jgi:hypothetical protein